MKTFNKKSIARLARFFARRDELEKPEAMEIAEEIVTECEDCESDEEIISILQDEGMELDDILALFL